MTKMLKWAPAVLLLLSPMPSAAADPIAPPVVRKAPPAATAPAQCGTAGAAACPEKRPRGSAEDYFRALASVPAASEGDALLDKGLMTAMSRLLESGRCVEAASLATRNDRAPLAARAQQLCRGN